MKNLIFTLALTLFAAVSAHAQATFDLSPDTVSVSAPVNVNPVIAYNQIINLTNTARNIRWDRTVVTISPDTLTTQVCDINACYDSTVNSYFFQLAANATGNISMYVNNNSGGPASALVRLKFTDLNSGFNQTAVYIFDASLVGTEDLPVANVKLFPNPVVESFSLGNDAEVHRVRVFALDGRLAALFEASPGQTYSLVGLPTGAYIVALESKNGKIFQAIEVRKD